MFSPSKLERFKVSKEELEKLGNEFFSDAFPLVETLYNTSYWILLKKKNASKIVKQTFLESIEYCNVTKNEADWPSWIYRIWMREINSFYSTRENDIKTNFEFIDCAQMELENESANNNKKLFNINSNQLIKLLAGLPAVLRIPLIMKEVSSFNYEKISELIDVPTGVAATRIYRARKLLFLLSKGNFTFDEQKRNWEQKESTKIIFELRKVSLFVDNELNELPNPGIELKNEIFIQQKTKEVLQNIFTSNFNSPSIKSKIERKAKKKFS